MITTENNQNMQHDQEVHEGELLYRYIDANRLHIEELAQQLGVTRQAIYLQSKRPYLSSRFRKKLKAAGIELFTGSHKSIALSVNDNPGTDTEKLLAEIKRLQQIVILQAEHIKEMGQLMSG